MKFAFFLFLSLIISFSSSFAAYFVSVPQQANAVAASAVSHFRNLSKKEKQARLSAVKKEVRRLKKEGAADEQTLLYVILAILLPPLAVYLHQGDINTKFWISLILTLCFWLPGVIYALLVVLDQI
jgi:uncharacterized membrane protein YqaE (UPF0057 family)